MLGAPALLALLTALDGASNPAPEIGALTDTREFNEAGARFSPDGKRLLYYRMAASDAVDNNTYGTFDLVLSNAICASARKAGRSSPLASQGRRA